MDSIFTIALNDLKQMLRDRKTFLFLLIMPIGFTYLFGFIFSGENTEQLAKMKVGLVNHDGTSIAAMELLDGMAQSSLYNVTDGEEQNLIEKLESKDLLAVVVIPQGFGDSLQTGEPQQLTLWYDPTLADSVNAQNEIAEIANRIANSTQTARILAPEGGEKFNVVLSQTLDAWRTPPVKVVVREQVVIAEQVAEPVEKVSSFAHSSPGMILQFAIAGLLTCAQVIVSERKNRCLQRLMTTATLRVHILLGHYLSIFMLLLLQFIVLILFGDLALGLNYHSQPVATALIAVSAALCISALGLLIGMLAKSEEVAVGYAMVCMFVLSGVGGAWVPLEITGETFQAIGGVTPVAWAMTGFKNILVRGLSVEAAWLPASALLGYAVVFFAFSALKFRRD